MKRAFNMKGISRVFRDKIVLKQYNIIIKGGIMRNRIKLWSMLGIVGFICMLLVTSCTLAKIYSRGATPIMLNNPPQKVEVIKHFSVSKGITFDFTSAFDASEMIAEVLQETRCDAIINVGLEVKTTVGDFFLNMITLGIAQAKHLVVTGDAIRYSQELSLDDENIEILADSDNLESLTSMLMNMSKKDQSRHSLVKFDNGYRLIRFKD